MLCTISSAADITGKWCGFPGCFTFKQDGTTLSGSVGPSQNQQYPFSNGTIEGDKISLKLGKTQVELRLEGDTIKGTLMDGGQSTNVLIKRVDETAGPRTFDVASIKRAAIASNTGTRINNSPGRMSATSIRLKRMITNAYHLKDHQVTGPDWLNSEYYDLAATYPPSTSPEQVLPMMQALLAERFKLEVHRETKELPIYALVLDKTGIKWKAVDPFEMNGARTTGGPKGRMITGNVSLDQLADVLANYFERPVINSTELKGVFEVKLEWTPDETSDGPSIHSALHEAGLKVEPRKAPVKLLVVDHAEKNSGGKLITSSSSRLATAGMPYLQSSL